MLIHFAILVLGLISFGCQEQQRPGRPASAASSDERGEKIQETGDPYRPMLLAFTRSHCPPCELMQPWLVALERRHRSELEIVDVDIESRYGRALAEYFGVAIVPSQIYVDCHGKENSRHQGVASLEMMMAAARRIIGDEGKRPAARRIIGDEGKRAAE